VVILFGLALGAITCGNSSEFPQVVRPAKRRSLASILGLPSEQILRVTLKLIAFSLSLARSFLIWFLYLGYSRFLFSWVVLFSKFTKSGIEYLFPTGSSSTTDLVIYISILDEFILHAYRSSWLLVTT